jgi:hypothetical protein
VLTEAQRVAVLVDEPENVMQDEEEKDADDVYDNVTVPEIVTLFVTKVVEDKQLEEESVAQAVTEGVTLGQFVAVDEAVNETVGQPDKELLAEDVREVVAVAQALWEYVGDVVELLDMVTVQDAVEHDERVGDTVELSDDVEDAVKHGETVALFE